MEKTMKFNKVSIQDPAVNNIVGATLLLPDGWMLEGGFVWTPLFFMQANLLVRAYDPQTMAAAETLPTQQYIWTVQPSPVQMQLGQNWLGSVYLPPPQNPVGFVQMVWLPGPLRHLSGARLDRVEDLPEYAAEFSRSQGPGQTVYAWRLRYVYQHNGRGWEEDVYVTLVFGQSNGVTVMWWSTGHTMRAPAGELDRMTPLLAVPIQSLRTTLDWSAMLEYVRGLFRQGRRDELANQKRLNELWIQHREEMRRAHQQVFEERQASQDRINFARREILGGIETYMDPFESRPVELPLGYSQYWVSNDGYIIGSNHQMFDPRSDSSREWQHMQRFRP